MLISPAYLSCFSTWNSRLEQSCFTLVVLAFHRRHPNFQRVQMLWSSNFGSPWKTTEWLHMQENQKPRHKVMLQRTEFIRSQSATLLILCARRREEHKCYMCDGLFYTKGQIFELNVTTASGLGQPGPTLQFVVYGRTGTERVQRVSILLQETLNSTATSSPTPETFLPQLIFRSVTGKYTHFEYYAMPEIIWRRVGECSI